MGPPVGHNISWCLSFFHFGRRKPKLLTKELVLKKQFLFLFFVALLISCNSLAGYPPTPIPNPSQTPTSISSPSITPSPIPAITSTPALELPPNLPEIPGDFTWKIIEETQIGFPIPDGWYYKEEKQGNTFAYFATKENIDEVKIFSTGLSINIVKDDSVKADEYAEFFIDSIVNADTTKKIIGNWHYSKGNIVSFQAEIEAEFDNVSADDPNRNKTIHYSTVADTDTNTLYVIIFESPTSIWDAEKEKAQYMLQVVLLGQ